MNQQKILCHFSNNVNRLGGIWDKPNVKHQAGGYFLQMVL